LFSNYYRVAFFGKQWRDLQGKEFVYRANDTVRLNDFTTRLKVASSSTKPSSSRQPQRTHTLNRCRVSCVSCRAVS
jgi:hypothetical protein